MMKKMSNRKTRSVIEDILNAGSTLFRDLSSIAIS